MFEDCVVSMQTVQVMLLSILHILTVSGCAVDFDFEQLVARKDDEVGNVTNNIFPPYHIKSDSGCEFDPSHEDFPDYCEYECSNYETFDVFKCTCLLCQSTDWKDEGYVLREICINWMIEECPKAYGIAIALLILLIILVSFLCSLIACFMCCRTVFNLITYPCQLCCKLCGCLLKPKPGKGKKSKKSKPNAGIPGDERKQKKPKPSSMDVQPKIEEQDDVLEEQDDMPSETTSEESSPGLTSKESFE